MYISISPRHINLGEVSFEQIAKLLRKYDFNAIEAEPLELIEQYTLDGVQDILGQNGLFISSFQLPVSFRHADDDAYQNELEGLVPAAKAARDLGIHRCFSFVLNFSDDFGYEDNFQIHSTRLREIACILEAFDIRLGLEFVGPKTLAEGHKYPFIRTLNEMQLLCRQIGKDNVGILLDCYHLYTSGQDFSAFDAFKSEKEIVVAHINDAQKGLPIDECLDRVRYLPGDGGAIPVKGFLEKLQAANYTGPVVLEPFSERINAMTDPDEILSVVRQSIDKVWPMGSL